MILTKKTLIRDGVIKYIALISISIGLGLTIYHLEWGKDPEENIIRFIGYLLILLGFILGSSTKSLRKGGIHKDGGKRFVFVIINMALYVFFVINYFVVGSFTALNAILLSVSLVFSLVLLYFGTRHPQQLR